MPARAYFSRTASTKIETHASKKLTYHRGNIALPILIWPFGFIICKPTAFWNVSKVFG